MRLFSRKSSKYIKEKGKTKQNRKFEGGRNEKRTGSPLGALEAKL